MNDAIRHYDELLAAHYSWMVGMPFEEKAAEPAPVQTASRTPQLQWSGPESQPADLDASGLDPDVAEAVNSAKQALEQTKNDPSK